MAENPSENIESPAAESPGPRLPAGAPLVRFASLGLLWLVLADGRPDSLGVGLPVMVLATWLSVRLTPPGRGAWRLTAWPAFAGYFLWRALAGSIDIAGRAMRPSRPLDPGLTRYRFKIAADRRTRVFLADAVSLLPGTLTAEVESDALVLHVVDRNAPVERDVAHLERLIGRMFGYRVPPREEAG